MFNLRKYSQYDGGAIEDAVMQGDLGGFNDKLIQEIGKTEDTLKGEGEQEELPDDNLEDQRQQLLSVTSLKMADDYIQKQFGPEGPVVWNMLINELDARNVATPGHYQNIAVQISNDEVWQSLDPGVNAEASQEFSQKILPEINDLVQRYKNRPQDTRVFNQASYSAKQKTAQMGAEIANDLGMAAPPGQMGAEMPPPEPSQGGTQFSTGGEFVAAFESRLLTDDPDMYREAANELLSAVQGEVQEEEINSAIETLWDLNPQTDEGKAICILGRIWEILPASMKAQQEAPQETIMSEINPKGIIKFNLSLHVLNNKTAQSSCPMVKTAADQFGQHYVLYGPSEKRICPKLRGKGGGQPGSGDVVSEYICRHHCLDGIVIDDNKTICGEALWRANSMDKYSREYVNADGEIVGGYLNKRFEINRNVPEENKMRLKPGETRKPRPASQGNLEARMQDMRNKEGEKRGYRPDTNTGKPFNWSKDMDQNNMQVSQRERDRRETASGHQLVQYTNKNKQENKPKVASGFNLKRTKTAQNTTGFDDLLWRIDEIQNENDAVAIQEYADKAIKVPQQWEIFHQRLAQKMAQLGLVSAASTQEVKESAKVENDDIKKVKREQLAVEIQQEHTNKEAWRSDQMPPKDRDNEHDHDDDDDSAYYRKGRKDRHHSEAEDIPLDERDSPRLMKQKASKTAQGGAMGVVVNDGKDIEPVEKKYRRSNKKKTGFNLQTSKKKTQ